MAARATAEGRLQRILAMVPWVVAHDGPSVIDVCARFDCTPTELASDIGLLYLCGLYPYTPDLLIEAAIVDGRVFIEYADYFSRPLRLTPAEGLSLVAAASSLLAAPGTDANGPLARGLAKLANAIGGAADAVEVELGAVEAETLAALREAAAGETQVVIDYYAFGRDERTTRTIEPAGVFSTGGQWYVSAYCHLAHDERLFRVDRIVALTATEAPRSGPAVPPTPGLFARRPAGGMVTLVLDASMQWVAEQYPVDATEPVVGGGVRVRLVVAEWPWLDRLVLRLGPGARIDDAPAGWPGRVAAAERVLDRYRR